MGTIRSCERLRHEHDVVGQVLGALDVLMQRSRCDPAVPPPPISGAVEFFSAFVDRCHDTKEEEGLFPMLDAYGMPDGSSIAALRAEHEEGRRLLGTLRPLSRRQPVDRELFTLFETYSGLLRRHMATENAEILPFAERVMSLDDDARLERTFERIEERTVGPGGREVLLALADAVTHACQAMVTEPTKGPPEEMVARQVMRPKPRGIAPEDSLARAAELMGSLGTREVPVVAGRTLVGILTRTDMEPHRGHYEWTAVRAAMTANPVTVPPEAPLCTVASLLLERGFNSVPVSSGEELVGMIARSDVLRVLAQNG